MGVKRKIKRKGKVIYLEDKVGVCYDGGIHALADETGLSMDEMFFALMRLCLRGIAIPFEVDAGDGRMRLNFRIARDEREMERMRRQMVEASREAKEGFGEWAELRDELFGKPPERPKKKD
ncbi:hypothetical protein ES703_125026 [subsurface metagenome]